MDMDMDNPPPVRFRAVIEWTFPDADPWNGRSYHDLLERVKIALESATTVNCKEVKIREAASIGPDDRYEQWRKTPAFDWHFLSPDCGHIFGASYPLAAVDPGDLAKVLELTSRAEAGEWKGTSIPVAIGQALGPEADASATIARAYILRALQKLHAVPAHPSGSVFEKAATFPIERGLADEAEMLALGAHFTGCL